MPILLKKLALFQLIRECSATSMLTESCKAFLLMDVDSQYDFFNPKLAMDLFNKDDVFVVSLTSFEDQSTLVSADVILPMASFYETSGTHINFDGIAQSFSASVKSPGDSKPGWKNYQSNGRFA